MRAFSSPPVAYAPLLTWLWNGSLQEDALRHQLRAIRAAGFGGIVLQAAKGHSTTYLSDEWLHLVQACVEECKALGLIVWIGDEDSGPSGASGGIITRQRPDLSSHYLKFYSADVHVSEIAKWHPPAVSGKMLYALATPLKGSPPRLDFARAATLTKVSPERYTEMIARLESDVRVFMFSEERDGYIDLLNPEATRYFLASTHERYSAFLGDSMGTTVAGFFSTDALYKNH